MSLPCDPLSGSDESLEVSVGDVTSHQLLNLKPGTTYDLKVLAQYNTGMSGPLLGQGTTRMYPPLGVNLKMLFKHLFIMIPS